MNIGEAVELLKKGKRVCRSGWNGKDMYLFLQTAQDPYLPFVIMKIANHKFVPWLCSQINLLADDWMEA